MVFFAAQGHIAEIIAAIAFPVGSTYIAEAMVVIMLTAVVVVDEILAVII